jgi:simple sugar transport system ATP-binding protein
MIYQDISLCDNMDVASNMFLGRWPTKGLFVDSKRMEADASNMLRKLRVDISSVRLKVDGLSARSSVGRASTPTDRCSK